MGYWYYVVDSEQQGPFTDVEFAALLSSGQVTSDTLVWTETMENWLPAKDVKQLVMPPQPQSPAPAAAPALEWPLQQPATEEPEKKPTGPIFLHIPIGRYLFMSVVSWGLYEAYWMYKNWKYLKQRDSLNIRPFWRAIFGVFYIFSLLKTMHGDKEVNAIEKASFPPARLATIWIVLVLIGNAFSRTEDATMYLIGTLISFPTFLLLVPVQKYINRVNAKLDPRPKYHKWSFGHIVCIILGILIWLGTLLPEVPVE